MRWFFDTEFHEDGRIIDLISIALINETGDKVYYAVSNEWDPSRCNEFVQQHVLPKLPKHDLWRSRKKIAAEVKELLLADGDKPELWAYFADYDWVALCQLYGKMIDLPKGFPFWCRDLKQLMEFHDIKKDKLPKQPEDQEHDALLDAKWVRDGYLYIKALEEHTHGT